MFNFVGVSAFQVLVESERTTKKKHLHHVRNPANALVVSFSLRGGETSVRIHIIGGITSKIE